MLHLTSSCSETPREVSRLKSITRQGHGSCQASVASTTTRVCCSYSLVSLLAQDIVVHLLLQRVHLLISSPKLASHSRVVDIGVSDIIPPELFVGP